MLHLRALLIAACLRTVHAGTCNDKAPDCGNWAQQGQCTSNEAFMYSTCPLACGVCPFQCEDTHESCTLWAQTGECEKNPDHMLRECPTACGICMTTTCKDLKKQCGGWSRDHDACNTNAEFMARTCPVTCGVCRPTCMDTRPDCSGWLALGECHKNPGFMYKTCPHSCGVCDYDHKIGCADHNITQCHIWHDSGECGHNPIALFKDCPESCGACSLACFDHELGCKGWAAEGRCETDEDKAFMLRVCPTSCGVCSDIEETTRKDEL